MLLKPTGQPTALFSFLVAGIAAAGTGMGAGAVRGGRAGVGNASPAALASPRRGGFPGGRKLLPGCGGFTSCAAGDPAEGCGVFRRRRALGPESATSAQNGGYGARPAAL